MVMKRQGSMNWKLIMRILKTPATVRYMASAIGISERSIQLHLDQMKSEGMAHICSWKVPPVGKSVPEWVLGEGVDVVRPMRSSESNHARDMRRYLARKERSENRSDWDA